MSSGITLEDSLSNPYSITGDHAKEINAGNLGIGAGQTWQDVTASRAVGTTYTNTTGRPIMVMFSGDGPGGVAAITIGGVIVGYIDEYSASSDKSTISFIVPDNTTYSIGSEAVLTLWSELR